LATISIKEMEATSGKGKFGAIDVFGTVFRPDQATKP